ncbi:SGNH/GDSL hydrolase family protein [Massilia sp. DJPM01]|uniref:SGNH/GDSL hydrolase family protein n=1 Tax=Massilia sp. DJPM01 TaxID=3024404 RepID=UPI00259E6D50|nr:SGNH/GDSL hydrolase family protein [Massilia sp. DJPM01]MDM5178515.1 SGNH/GDSL hydrolase family protein [Massilia sp. DJPM01]
MADKVIPIGDGATFKRYKDMGDGTHAEVISIPGLGLSTTEGIFKPFGGSLNNVTFNQSAGLSADANAGFGQKGEAEAPFDAIRLVWINRAGNELVGCSALVGVTETAASDTNAKISQPHIGASNGGVDGVAYGNLAPAGSILGWRPVTVNGATSWNVPSGATGVGIVVSDWIPLSSLKNRTDGGTRPLWMFRTQHDGATGGNFAFLAGAGIAQLRTAIAAARNRILQFFYAGLGVSNPAAVGGFNNSSIEVFPVFRYRVKARSVMIIGDSTSQGDGLTSGVYNNWGWRGCADASTPQRPINYINQGCSSKSAAEYWQRAKEIMNAGIVPTDVVCTPGSVNDAYANIDRKFETNRARAFEMMDFCRAKGVRNLFWMPLLPFNNTTALQDAYRLEFNAFLAGLPDSKVLQFPGMGDGGAPERWAGATGKLGTSKGVITITNASPAVVTRVAHGLAVNTPVELSSTGSLPAGVPVGARLFVASVIDVDNITLSATLGGPALNSTTAGSGTHTLLITQDGFHENEYAQEVIMAPVLTAALNATA